MEKRFKTFVVLTFALLISYPLSAVAQDADLALTTAIQQFNEAANSGDINGIGVAKAAFQRIHEQADTDGWAAYYMGLSAYKLASSTPDTKQQLGYLEEAIEILEPLVKENEQHAEAAILLSGALGWKIGLKPMQGMFLGPKADRMAEMAHKVDGENPRVVMLMAVSDFNTPAMFGGDKEAALEGFEKAAQLFETYEAPDPHAPTWGHDDTYAWIGQAHAAEKRYDEAKIAFEKALEINPLNGWVRMSLLPAVEEKLVQAQ